MEEIGTGHHHEVKVSLTQHAEAYDACSVTDDLDFFDTWANVFDAVGSYRFSTGEDTARAVAAATYLLTEDLPCEPLSALHADAWLMLEGWYHEVDQPLWQLQFRDDSRLLCEVWLDEKMTSARAVYAPDILAKADQYLLAAQGEQTESPITAEALRETQHHIVWSSQREQWGVFVQTGSRMQMIWMLPDTDYTLV